MKLIFKNVQTILLCAMCVINLFYKLKGEKVSKKLISRINGGSSRYNGTFASWPIMEFKSSNETVRNLSFTNLFVLESNKKDDDFINFVEENGFLFIRKIFKDANYYLFRHRTCCIENWSDVQRLLRHVTKHVSVKWAEHQTSLKRVHRTEELLQSNNYRKDGRPLLKMPDKMENNASFVVFDDPLFKEQWYLLNRGQTGSPPGNDINVLPVWESGITGKGVRISVLDDGIDPGCEEVADNYDSISSADFSYIHRRFVPVAQNSHGTYCAAIAAGVANNGVCGVGVAYDAKIGGVRILDGPITDAQEAMALVHALDYVDIYTASWGPNDDGKNIAGPRTLAKLAFEKGVTEGRGGKGAIYVWAAGNGGRNLDNCNVDGYASSPYTLTIGALTAEGRSAYYSEPCAAVIAATYVGGSHRPLTSRNIRRERRKIKVVVPEGKGRCRQTFQGTSAAAPMAAGVIALALQANPFLSWRDIQHIIVKTSRVPATGENGWSANAAGHRFHLKMGFGVLDAEGMVKAAERWKSVGPLVTWTSQAITDTKVLLPHNSMSIPLLVRKSSIHSTRLIDQLESVIATVGIAKVPYGHLELFLVSPSGTRSQILTRRPNDNENTHFQHWDFLTLHFWNEHPYGWWRLVVSNHADRCVGVLQFFSLTLLGTTL